MKALENWHLLRFCKKHQIDTYEIDKTLTYYENLNHLEQLIPNKELPIPEIDEIIEQTVTYKEIIEILKEQLTIKRATRNKQQQIFDKIISKMKQLNICIGFESRFFYNLIEEETKEKPTLAQRQRVSRLLKKSEQIKSIVNSNCYYRTQYNID